MAINYRPLKSDIHESTPIINRYINGKKGELLLTAECWFLIGECGGMLEVKQKTFCSHPGKDGSDKDSQQRLNPGGFWWGTGYLHSVNCLSTDHVLIGSKN